MIKLSKYLKKSVLAIIFVIVLLFIQAQAELSLPEYTSKIVNVGIQQSGIQNTYPDVMRESTFKSLNAFFNDSDYQKMSENYQLITSDKATAKQIKEYPSLKNENLYTLKSSADVDFLTDVFPKPLLIYGKFSVTDEQTEAIRNSILSNPKLSDELSSLNLVDLLNALPREVSSGVIASMSEQLDTLDSSMINQSAFYAIKGEYTQIGVNLDKMQTSYILVHGGIMIGITLLSVIATILVTLLSSVIAAGFARDVRTDTFSKVIRFSDKEFGEFSTASLITRCTNDIQQVHIFIVVMFRMVFYAPIIGVGALIKVMNTNGNMTWIIGTSLGFIVLVMITMFVVVVPKIQIVQKLVDKLNLVSREILNGLPVVRAFNKEKHEKARFTSANEELMKNNLFVNRVMSFLMPTMMLVMNVVSVAIVWIGAKRVDSGTMQVGDMLAYIQYSMQIIMAFLMLSMISIMLPRALVAGNRINEVLEKKPSINDKESPESFSGNVKGVVEFKNVSFRYPNADSNVLENISFVAESGKTTAIIGSTGSGKSTLINLIPRFFDINEGEILVNGIDVRNVSQHDLREKIGYVPQKGILFSGTIKSNIAFGNTDMSDENIKFASMIAQADEFIEQKSDGFDSEISQGGNNVSGGQKQRLSIARAVAKSPEILIFDDSFSALDYKTDKALRRALKVHIKDSTVLIVAQRVSTILNADKIIVLENGTIAGQGTHSQLLRDCEIYQQIALSQLSKEELENVE